MAGNPAADSLEAVILKFFTNMTKVTLHYDLEHKLTEEEDYTNIAAIHSVYGMVRVQLAPTLDKITVDYDASRLMKKDVEAALGRYGIPVASPAAV